MLLVLLLLQVTDTNDNPPVFSQWAYSMEVLEDAPRGARVGQVSAKDLDEGPNGLVSYSVVSDWANDVFSLHPQTGIFTLAARLDYEEVSAPCCCRGCDGETSSLPLLAVRFTTR